MVEDQGDGEFQAGRGGQPVAQLDGGQRVEPGVAERAARLHLVGRGVAEHGGGVRADQVGQHPVSLGRRQPGQLGTERLSGRTARTGRPVGAARQDAEQGRHHGVGPGLRDLGAQCGHVEPGRDEQGVVQGEREVEQRERLLGRHRGDAAPGHPVAVTGAEVAGQAAGVGPQPPGQRDAGQPGRPAVGGQGVEEGVAGGVVALPGRAERRGGRGEQGEEVEVEAGGEPVQMPGAVGLGTHDGVDPVGGQRADDPVVEHAGGVHDTGQRDVGRDPGQQPGQGAGVGGVAGDDVDGRPRFGQAGDQVGDPCGLRAAAAREQQPGGATGHGQVAGDQPGEGAGATGDEHGPGGGSGGEGRGVGEGGVPRDGRGGADGGAARDGCGLGEGGAPLNEPGLADSGAPLNEPGLADSGAPPDGSRLGDCSAPRDGPRLGDCGAPGNGFGLGEGGADEAAAEGPSGADREFGFAGADGGGEHADRLGGLGRVGGQVGEDQPVGVLRLRGAHQAPRRGGGQIGDSLATPGRHGATADEDQPGLVREVEGEPALDQIEHLGGRAAGRLGGVVVGVSVGADVGGAGVADEGQDHFEIRVEFGAQVGAQVGAQAAVESVAESGVESGAESGVESGAGLHVDPGGGERTGEVERVVARYGPATGRSRHGDRDGRPGDGEHRVAGAGRGGPDRLQRDRAQGHRLHGHGRAARGVGRGQGQSFPVEAGQAGAQGGGPGGVQGGPGPGGRQEDVGGAGGGPAGAGQRDRVEGGGQQGRVQAVDLGLLGQGHLCEQVVAVEPRRLRERDRACGRPGRGGRGRGGRAVGGDAAVGVAGPGVVRAGAPGVDLDRALAVGVGFAHGDLDLQRRAGLDRQRPVGAELGDPGTAGLVAGHDREFGEHGRGGCGLAEPGLVGEGEPPGDDQAAAVGEFDRRAEQRVADRVEPGRADVARAREDRPVPVALVLEGVGRQGDPASGGKHLRPVDGDAVRVRLGQRGQHAGGAALVPAERAGDDRRPVGLGLVEGGLDGGGQHRMGGGLDEDGVAGVAEHPDGVGELDGVAEAGVPVRGVGLGALQDLAGHGRRHRQPAGPGDDGGQQGEDLVAELLDLRAVGGVADGEPPGPHPGRLAGGGELVEGGGIAGDHGRVRAVDRGDVGPAGPREQPGLDRVGRFGDREHAAASGQRRQRAAAEGHHSGRVVQGEDPGDDGRGDLALGVPEHRVGAHPGRLPHRRKRHHDRPQRRLHHVDPVEVQVIVERPVDIRREGRTAFGHPCGEHRAARGELPAHARPLRALAGEHEHHAPAVAAGRHGAGHGRGRRLSRRDGRQPGEQFPPGTAEDDGAVLEHRTGGGQRPRHVADRLVARVGQPVRHVIGQVLGPVISQALRHTVGQTVRQVIGQVLGPVISQALRHTVGRAIRLVVGQVGGQAACLGGQARGRAA